MKNNAAIDYLDREAERFTNLAKDISLELLKHPTAPGAVENKRRAEDHLMRAETFKDAARIVLGHSGRGK